MIDPIGAAIAFYEIGRITRKIDRGEIACGILASEVGGPVADRILFSLVFAFHWCIGIAILIISPHLNAEVFD